MKSKHVSPLNSFTVVQNLFLSYFFAGLIHLDYVYKDIQRAYTIFYNYMQYSALCVGCFSSPLALCLNHLPSAELERKHYYSKIDLFDKFTVLRPVFLITNPVGRIKNERKSHRTGVDF